jgi:CTP synthase (UTP-ammonia lyase)
MLETYEGCRCRTRRDHSWCVAFGEQQDGLFSRRHLRIDYVRPGTRIYHAYGRIQSVEEFRSSYGLAPNYRQKLTAGPLEVTAVGSDDEERAIELRDHPFFVATLFLLQLSSSGGRPYPLIGAFLRGAAEVTKL